MQNKQNLFKKYYKRIALEGIFKSLFLAVIIGFSATFVVATVSWFFGFDFGLILSIVVAAVTTVASGLFAYFFKYRPTTKAIARRVDRLGLEERLITMLELENDNSYIAMRQREDAKRCMAEVDSTRIKLAVSKGMLTLAIVAVLMGGTMTTAVGLAQEGIIPDGAELITGTESREDFVSISYVIEEGGEIVGIADQIFERGQDAQPITAVAIDGWVFKGWSDGLLKPGRHDLNVTKDLELIAYFEEIGEGDGSDEPTDGESSDEQGGEEDMAKDEPGDGSGSGSSDSSDNGDGDSDGDSDNDSESDNDGNSDNAGGGEGGGAGGKYEDKNLIIDGETYYHEKIDEYYEKAMEIIAAGGEIPEELRAFIEKYYDSI